VSGACGAEETYDYAEDKGTGTRPRLTHSVSVGRSSLRKTRDVSRENKKGFGSGALKVKGKIFAMVSSKGEFVVKLPEEGVDKLVSSGAGQRFDPGHGRVMKEWVVVRSGNANWTELAAQAYQFVKAWG